MSAEQNIRVAREDFLRGFSELSLTRGHKIIAHSSLSSFGFVEGGALTVIHALMNAVTDEGLLVMPAFTYGRDAYDAARSVSRTGKIAEEFRAMPGVFRSLHPTHSLCAWGKDAENFLAGHDRIDPFGSGSPLHRFLQEDGYILLLGVTHTSNCVIHVAQEIAHVPYIDRPKKVRVKRDGGNEEEVEARRAGCSLGFDKIIPYLEKRNVEKFCVIGKARLRFMKAKDVMDVAVEIFKNDPAALLCDRAECFSCNEARAMMPGKKK